jgi:cell pole-organizing protein PopZ
MSQTAKVQEPSMEEILASIRRIIADDDANKPATPPAAAGPAPRASGLPPAPPPAAVANSQDDIDAMLANLDTATPAQPESDVLDLTESMAAPAPAADNDPAVTFRTIDAASDVIFTDRASDPPEPAVRIIEEPRRPAAHSPAPAPRPAPRPAPPRASNPMPDRPLISSSTVAAVDSAFNSLAHTVIGQNARTLEDLVKEMLRPLLKSWLDDNLPGVVDRIVRAEIERVSRGRP